MANEDAKPGFWGWAQKHWFLTFLLAGSALSVPAGIISAAKGSTPTPGAPPVPPANPNVGPAAPFKSGDVVVVDIFQGHLAIPGQPTGSATVQIDSLVAGPTLGPPIQGEPPDQFASTFMGHITSPIQSQVLVIPRAAVTGIVSRS